MKVQSFIIQQSIDGHLKYMNDALIKAHEDIVVKKQRLILIRDGTQDISIWQDNRRPHVNIIFLGTA